MKKLISLVVIVAIVLISPYFIGQKAEEKVRNMYAQLDQHPQLKISLKEYNRGWFTASAQAELAIELPQDDNLPFEMMTITIDHQLQHGPVLVNNGIGLGLADITYDMSLPSEIAAAMPTELDELTYAMENFGRIAFDGSLSSLSKIHGVTMPFDTVDIEILPGEFTSNISMDGQITANGQWQGMKIKEDDTTVVTIGELTLDSTQQIIRGDIFSPMAISTGDFTIELANILVHSPNTDDEFGLDKMTFTGNITEDDNKLNAVASLVADKLTVIDQEYNEITYNFSMKNLDIDSYQQLMELFAKLQTMNEQEQAIAMMQLQQLLPQLVSNGFSFSIDKLGFKADEGEIDSNMIITFDADLFDPNNPMTMMMAIDAKANGSAPLAFFESIGKTADIDAMIQQNVLVKEDDKITFSFSFSNGQALLNGAPMPM
ncbi:DUF945 family protein [Thalassotalea crassostreae]|uniref:DUF945 family protein n=1 Tax=Thalassotalea crassostreae TaxID=1763536 RepID=UPI0008381292|nr:DUF945 family protein [Thalassotalea crassostreae]